MGELVSIMEIGFGSNGIFISSSITQLSSMKTRMTTVVTAAMKTSTTGRYVNSTKMTFADHFQPIIS